MLAPLAAIGLSLVTATNAVDLGALFQADQQTVQLEPDEIADPLAERRAHLEQRMALFEWMAERLDASTEELIQSAIILQHSNFDEVSDSGGAPWSQDNHLFAFFLARRAWLAGHRDGAWLMSATIARWLRIHQLPPELGLVSNPGGTLVTLRDPALSDTERLKAGLPLRLEQLIRRH